MVADTLKADVTTTLEAGKTYVIGAQYDMCKVSFTASADGFLSITPSQKVSSTSLKINGASSTFTKVDGGISKKGMAAGSVFEGTFYTSGTPSAENVYALVVTFEEGTPYTPLTMTLASPEQGGEWSGAAQYKNYGTKGVPHFEFSSILATDVTASVTIDGKVYSPIKCTVDGYNPKLDITGLPDTLSAAIAAGLIKAGETFTLTLSNIVDKEFAANTMKDTTFTYTVASTACTGVEPASNMYRQILPEEVVFSFDGTVKIDTAKFYFVNKFNGEKTELTGATAEGTALTISVPAIEGMLPKLYDIVAEGVTDENGKTITYGDTQGALTVSYGTSNGYFKPVVEPANNSNPTSLKTYTMTLPGAVVYDATQAYDTIFFGKYNEATYGFDPYEDIQVSYEINENVITFTLSKEVTVPGDYRLSVPSKAFWAKELYDAENLSDATCYYMPSQNISTTILPYGPTSVTPEPGAMLNKLDKITLAFDQAVECDEEAKVQVVMMKEIMGEWGWPEYVEDTIASVSISYDYENDNNMIIDLGLIDSVGNYTIHIPEGAIWAAADESKKIGKWVYNYQVDPDYWDPEWFEKVSGTSEESPAELIAGRNYEFSDMYAYAKFTAEEDGRLYFNILDGRTYVDLSQCDSTWWHLGSLSKTEEGTPWVGVEAGKSYFFQDYGFGARQYQVTFEAGSPYDVLEYTGSFPVDFGQYSKSTDAPESWETGAVEFYFSTKVNKDSLKVYVAVPSKDKKIDVTEDITFYDGAIDYGKTPAYLALTINDVIDDIKAENDLKAGDTIQVVLENVQDNNFASNALDEPLTVNMILAATVCTSINPDPSYGVEGIPTELSLRFDGDVKCINGKGYIIDVKSGNKQEFAIDSLGCEQVETWSGIVHEAVLTLPEATVELTSKKFAIEIVGLKDAAGNVVSNGDEVGKFVIDYKMRDDNFNYVAVDPEDESNVTSIKTTKLTFAEKVHLNPNADLPTIWANDSEITGAMAVDPDDEKSVIITWSEEITAAGEYYPNIPSGAIYNSKYDATKEDLGLEDGAGYNPYISLSYYILADVSSTTIASISPAPYEGWGSTSLNSLPSEVVIEFEGNVKEVVNAYGMMGMWSTRSTEIPEDAIALEAKLEDNKVVVTIPAEVIASVTMGNFDIVVNAVGEDGKPIGSASNPYAENISFTYYVEQSLQVTASEPADGSTVKELNTVTLTFDRELAEYDSWADAPCLLNAEDDSKVADFAYELSGNQLILTLAEPVTTTGSYCVYVPDWALSSADYVGNTTPIYLFVDVDPNYVDELSIVSATPENGATVENLTTVEFKLNKEVGYLYKSMLIPSDGGDDAASASLTQSESDPTSYTLDFTFEGLMKDGAALRKDVTYTLTLEAYASEEEWQRDGAHETVTLTYVGAYEGFQYSELKLESITPAEDFVISEKSQNKFVVKFNGPVELVESLTYVNMGQGATQAFESVVANDGKTEYTLTIAESVLETIRGTVNIVFAANDLDGKRLEGNNGEGEFSTFAYYYTTTIGVPDLTVTPDAAVEQATISTITIGCADGLIPSWIAGNITLTDANGNAIELNEPEAVVAEGASEWDTPSAWTVALKEELTAIGAYTLTIPAGYFNIGKTQGQVMGSKETVVVFNITQAAKDAAGIKAVTVDSDVVVYNVAGVAVANGKASEVLKNLNKGIYIVNGKKYVVK